MSIITQSTKMYSRPDKVKHIKDSMDVVNLLQLSDDTKGSINDIRSKILYIANVSSFDLRDLKNDILELNNKTLAWREYSYPWENFFSIEYNTLKKVHSTIMWQNPQAFLQLLLTNINTLLQEHLPSSFELTKIPNISEEVASINANWTNFNEQFNKISNSLWHSWEILFLQECIKQNLCIENIIDFSSNQMQNKKWLDWDNLFIYCDYNNIKSLAETKQKFLVNESTLDVNIDINKRKAFCLSWGISSGLIQLWYIQQHIENWWTISALSWSSIWWVIGSLVAFAWNDPEKISNLVSNLKKQFGDAKFEDGWDISTNDKMIIKDIFIKAWRIVWIDEHTIFSDSIIPITINASREYWWFWLLGEQEVMLWWEHKSTRLCKSMSKLQISTLRSTLWENKSKLNGVVWSCCKWRMKSNTSFRKPLNSS